MREARITIEIWSVHTDKPVIEGVSEGEAWKHFLRQTGGDSDARLLRGTTVVSSLGKLSPVVSRRRF